MVKSTSYGSLDISFRRIQDVSGTTDDRREVATMWGGLIQSSPAGAT